LEGKTYHFEGIVEGEICAEKSGQAGFGYDPIFKPTGEKEHLPKCRKMRRMPSHIADKQLRS